MCFEEYDPGYVAPEITPKKAYGKSGFEALSIKLYYYLLECAEESFDDRGCVAVESALRKIAKDAVARAKKTAEKYRRPLDKAIVNDTYPLSLEPAKLWDQGVANGGPVMAVDFTGGAWLRGAGSRLGTRSRSVRCEARVRPARSGARSQPIHPGARVRPARASEPGGSARRSGRNHRAARRSISPAPSEAARPAPAASPAATTNPFTSPSQQYHSVVYTYRNPHNNPDHDEGSDPPIKV